MPEWTRLFTTSAQGIVPAIAEIVAEQARHNDESFNLVASESYAPRVTMELEGSHLLNKNASGYPPRHSFGDSHAINQLEGRALSRAKQIFGAEHANIQALSSTIANVAVLRALLNPGDRILSFAQGSGGHSSHGGVRHLSGQDYEVKSFGLHPETERVDYDEARRLALAFSPRMIVAGSTWYPFMLDFRRLKAIADECGAMLFVDIAHVAGLVAAGLHDNPIPYADVATTSTHKTLCGPRTGGLTLAKAKYAQAIDAAISPGLQAAPGAHMIAARAALFELVAMPEFASLMRKVLSNAEAFAHRLQRNGLKLFANGTDTHMLVVDIRQEQWDEFALNDHLVKHGIVANTMTIPAKDGLPGRLGLRLGSTPMTIRGAREEAFEAAADALAVLLAPATAHRTDAGVQARMKRLGAEYPVPFQ